MLSAFQLPLLSFLEALAPQVNCFWRGLGTTPPPLLPLLPFIRPGFWPGCLKPRLWLGRGGGGGKLLLAPLGRALFLVGGARGRQRAQ
jgi:hypothetical protein